MDANGKSGTVSTVADTRSLLLAIDNRNTALAEHSKQTLRRVYSAYGQEAGNVATGYAGFNGEYREQGGFYLLGSHRTYDPLLMRFRNPDRLSPFARGGLNAYAYCLGDPVNHVDPTGRIPSWVVPVIGIGLSAAGLGLAVASALAAASLTGGMMAVHVAGAAAGVAGGVTGVTSSVLHVQGDSERADIFGYVSLGLGAASLLTSMSALAMNARATAGKGARKLATPQKGLKMDPWEDYQFRYKPGIDDFMGQLHATSDLGRLPANSSGLAGSMNRSSSAVAGASRKATMPTTKVSSSGSATARPQAPLNVPSGMSQPREPGVGNFLSKLNKVRSSIDRAIGRAADRKGNLPY